MKEEEEEIEEEEEQEERSVLVLFFDPLQKQSGSWLTDDEIVEENDTDLLVDDFKEGDGDFDVELQTSDVSDEDELETDDNSEE